MKNRYELRGDVAIIFVKHKDSIVEIIIDVDDLVRVDDFPNTWHISSGYVTGYYYHRRRHGGLIKLHRLLVAAPDDKVVDHINRNPLDNRKCNLRICTRAENNQNLNGARKHSQTGIRNVSIDKKTGKFSVRVGVGGKSLYLGTFNTVSEATEVAENARKKYLPYHESIA